VKPEQAVNYPIGYGPYAGKTIGWIGKFEKTEGLRWLFRQFTTARLNSDCKEAIRTFFAAPKYAAWLNKTLPEYPGCEKFWLPKGHAGCLACGEHALSTDAEVRCEHGIVRDKRVILRCQCGWTNESILLHLRGNVRRKCGVCDDPYPLFRSVGHG
jgi:hypothetical protein